MAVAGLLTAFFGYFQEAALAYKSQGVSYNTTDVKFKVCLLYTSDAADERSSVDLGGRRIIKKKKSKELVK